ncbi:MAG: NADP-dependent phosphogluconate dehydrogenase [Propionibacteriaceae bacterium]|jgi:6-phosphogluconate dehydrogenase|nr:NADP-dependent phosphogluconate dehydrogenase [Propionibacteriaceae bacterium]
MSATPACAQIGVIGMAVMGSNLARNLAHHGYRTAIYNRTTATTVKVAHDFPQEGFVVAESLPEFVASLERPRRMILMVKAGVATDATIDALIPLLDKDDIIVDGGNSFFQDTRRREARLRDLGLHFVGSGISGGEVGALEGPAIMPGGSQHSYHYVGRILEDISAKYEGEPCCAHIGPDGAGHFVKMIHNGIEYADMQFIGEAYELLRAAGFTTREAADIFATWNTGDLSSYLIEITAEVLRHDDPTTGLPLVDVITDAAGMKGTGTWTVQEALNLGVPASTIAEAVFARATSSSPELRAAGQEALTGPDQHIEVEDRDEFTEQVRQALWASKVVAYAQGLDEIRVGAEEYGWSIDVASVARIWRAGCIIRARLLDRIANEYAANHLVTLLEAPSIAEGLAQAQVSWRRVVASAVEAGVPAPGFASALTYYDQVRAPRLNAALTQGLRDFFGAHTYRRIDRPGSFHTLWSDDRSEVRVSD